MKFWRLPLDAGEQLIPVGDLFIIADRCKGCGFCWEFCPNDILLESKGFNKKGYHPPVVREEVECNNCGICEVICPEFAIYSKVREKRCFNNSDLLRREEVLLSGE
jgi:2-oxoglutarate ferredoxin oxidoreductase subunit delta